MFAGGCHQFKTAHSAIIQGAMMLLRYDNDVFATRANGHPLLRELFTFGIIYYSCFKFYRHDFSLT